MGGEFFQGMLNYHLNSLLFEYLLNKNMNSITSANNKYANGIIPAFAIPTYVLGHQPYQQFLLQGDAKHFHQFALAAHTQQYFLATRQSHNGHNSL